MEKSKNLPLVSVIMPVYNAGDYLTEAIKSIVDQTYDNFELIIIDDASIDSSWKIICQFKKQYPDLIKSIKLKQNLNRGGDACANIAFQKASGKYICRMDADDIADPARIEKQVAYMEKYPDVLLLGTQAHVINKNGEIIGDKLLPLTHKDIYKGYAIFHPIIHPSVMLRKSLLPKGKNLYTIKYSANNDLYTFFKLLNIGRFANLAEKLVYYRVHGHNDSLTKPKEKFLNTLKIRLGAIQNGYKPTLTGLLLTLAQTLAILILPERLIVPVYLYMKGISKPVLININKMSSVFVLSKLKTYVMSFL